MSVGFRKSFFGFNCEDVLGFIENSHKEFAAKEKNFNKTISQLNSEISDLENKITELEQVKSDIQDKLDAYNAQKEEIDRVSKNIGKLYLVAQSNARSIIKSNEESLAAAREEAQRNISSIESAHNVLSEIKSELLEKTAEFNDSLEGLSTELDKAKSVIKENEAESEAKIEEVNKFVSSL